MPCYQPLIRVEHQKNFYLNKNAKLSKKAHIYSLSEYAKNYEDIEQTSDIKKQQIPCGQCIGCRLDYSRQWANRGYLESLLHEQNYFITLTYDDEHLPMNDFCTTKEGKIYVKQDSWTGTVQKRDLQLFFKRLRKRIPKFSYLACGEYGSKNGRPHYHAILFGAELPAETFYNARLINHEFYYQNDIIEECWTEEMGRGRSGAGRSLGYSNISEANWNTIAYTARYVVKKQKGVYAEEERCKLGRNEEFIVSSRNPAIGKEYFNLHHTEIIDKDSVLIKNDKGSYRVTRPRYFDKLIEKYNEEQVQEDKDQRQAKAERKAESKDRTTTLTRKEQLKVEESTKLANAKQLIRPLDGETVTKGRDSWGMTSERPRPRKEKEWLPKHK